MSAIEKDASFPRITLDTIKRICKERKDLYETVELNEKLFLNFGGYQRIESLDTLPQLRSLWLDSNNIQKVEGLDALVNLRSLFLQNNHITDISGLAHLKSLEVLDISSNHVTDLSPLSDLTNLHTLVLSSNQITDLKPLLTLKSLRVLDASKNALSDFPSCLSTLSQLSLRSLHLSGNPFSEEPNYRRNTVVKLPLLRFLDDRTITPDERRICSAWAVDGTAGELRERENTLTLRREREAREMSAWRVLRGEQLRASAGETANERAAPVPESSVVVPQCANAGKRKMLITVVDDDGDGKEDVSGVGNGSSGDEVTGTDAKVTETHGAEEEEEGDVDKEIDYTDIHAIAKLGSRKIMGGVEQLFPVRPSAASAQAVHALEKGNSSVEPTVRYSIVDMVKKTIPKDHFVGYSDLREAGVDWIAAQREDNLDNMVFGNNTDTSLENNGDLPVQWPEWLCDALYTHSEECAFDWCSVSDRLQADVCRAVREGRDEEVDAAACYTADACRLKYFEMEFGGEEDDGDNDDMVGLNADEEEEEVDMEALD